MPNFRRYRVPGGTYFFTVVTYDRRPIFRSSRARELLGQAYRAGERRWAFHTDAVVLLDDHLHAVWTLPHGDENYSRRWAWIKKEFTAAWVKTSEEGVAPVTAAESRERRRGVWQPRYWEHAVRDDDDFERCLDYVHYNPVKHGYVTRAKEWPWSSFSRWVARGQYEPNWGGEVVADGVVKSTSTFGE